MPKSKVRKQEPYAATREKLTSGQPHALAPSPAWYPIAMVIVLVIGLAYIVVYYLAGERVPVMRDIGAWNFGVGFTAMIIGLMMAVRWR